MLDLLDFIFYIILLLHYSFVTLNLKNQNVLEEFEKALVENFDYNLSKDRVLTTNRTMIIAFIVWEIRAGSNKAAKDKTPFNCQFTSPRSYC